MVYISKESLTLRTYYGEPFLLDVSYILLSDSSRRIRRGERPLKSKFTNFRVYLTLRPTRVSDGRGGRIDEKGNLCFPPSRGRRGKKGGSRGEGGCLII